MTFHKQIRLVGTVTVGPKGQVVIPSEVRDDMNIQPGDKLLALYVDNKKSIAFVTEAQAQEYITIMGDHLVSMKESLGKD